ncbi:MAG: hypothetical protein KGL39_24065 [Patescibacteria group bacterium]|nr:hypothetical protein [Patescibacteria group bacterium]
MKHTILAALIAMTPALALVDPTLPSVAQAEQDAAMGVTIAGRVRAAETAATGPAVVAPSVAAAEQNAAIGVALAGRIRGAEHAAAVGLGKR